MKYSVTLQNFASAHRTFPDYASALTHAKSIGFETVVWFDSDTILASYSPLYGLRVHNRELAGMEPGLTLADAVAINGRPVAR